MRVLLDATAVPTDRGGVGRYVDELVPELDRLTNLILVTQTRDVERYRALAPSAQVEAAPSLVSRRPVRMLWEQTGLPALARRVHADVIHSPHYTMPVATRLPVVVTLHDATFFSSPELHLRSKGVFFRTWTRLSARRATDLLVPSAATREAVSRVAHIPAEKITVAYHGVDHTLFHPVDNADRERVRRTFDIGDLPYIAFLGTLEPRKNVPALIRGWVQASQQLSIPPALVLAGARGWDKAVDEALAEVPSHLTVRVPGYLPLADLPGFLGGATVLAYPSLGEGFGLPVLEAMACGATVLTTRELSIPEVGGNSVAYCGTEAASIAAELLGLLNDPARRAQLGMLATKRAADFTWKQAAHTHLKIYRAAAKRRH